MLSKIDEMLCSVLSDKLPLSFVRVACYVAIMIIALVSVEIVHLSAAHSRTCLFYSSLFGPVRTVI